MLHRSPKHVSSCGVIMIIFQLLVFGTEARVLLPEKASSLEDKNFSPVGSVAQVESTVLAADTESLSDTSAQIGSRPPSCQNKCNSCNPCQAVQVPTPQDRRTGHGPTPAAQGSQIMNEYSNYIPEGWKCKCGNRFFNP
ncbi:hypothetical protein O6H91_12G020300 [Diphasiastrum complanatum]|uniref:Uncharacterized protein n=1 Tax=Diphasiastrum complanatum TaxID=34168 RepID=A0ACC2BZE9_DIPCM|nr:hypothetical protein O6H91_12G020300 [Diphasiastrum complanatum]